jgi:hypothetical protein
VRPVKWVLSLIPLNSLGKVYTAVSRGTHDEVLEIDGHRRLVRRRATACSDLYRRGKIAPRLMTAFDEVVKAGAQALGAATEDHHRSTSKLISGYDGMALTGSTALIERIGGQPSWFSPHDSQLEATRLLKHVLDRLPPEMRDVFEACLREEIGAQTEKALTLTELGQQRGYLHKQASAAGGVVVADMVAIVAHAWREYSAMRTGNGVHLKSRREWPTELR